MIATSKSLLFEKQQADIRQQKSRASEIMRSLLGHSRKCIGSQDDRWVSDISKVKDACV